MPDLVVMKHKQTGAVHSVPEASVEGFEFYGWARANKTLQAQADEIRDQAIPDPTAQAQEG